MKVRYFDCWIWIHLTYWALSQAVKRWINQPSVVDDKQWVTVQCIEEDKHSWRGEYMQDTHSIHTLNHWFDFAVVVTLQFTACSPSAWLIHLLTFWKMEGLEVNNCAFNFSSEIRQIQCTCTEFWCLQCPRPTGPSALDKHQIQASALDLSYFPSKSKCKFINLIHTRQKNKIFCSCSWKIINKMAFKMSLNMNNVNNFTQWKIWISWCDAHARNHAPKAPPAVWAHSGRSTRSAVDIFNTLHIFTKQPIREQEIKLECINLI